MDEATIATIVACAYRCATEPDGWAGMMMPLAGLFRCHFADVFARTHDYRRYAGEAWGLDAADYQQNFLDTWVKRNVWGKQHPTRLANEVISTRDMIAKPDLRRSAMYNEYLAPRGLHEGLRLTLSVGQVGIQDISLLRPWSAGPFTRTELDLAARLLPHLQHAAAVSRRMGDAGAMRQAGTAVLDALDCAGLVLDLSGRVVHLNRIASALLARQDGLVLARDGLHASQRGAEHVLTGALRLALGGDRRTPRASTVELPRPSGARSLRVSVTPLEREGGWSPLAEPMALVLVQDPDRNAHRLAARLAAAFGLTEAETDLARQLMVGLGPAEVARRSGRSVNTVRTQLASLMAKTGTRRQSALVARLMAATAERDMPAIPFR